MSFKLDKHVKELEYLVLCNGRNHFAIRLGLAIEIEPTQISVGSVCEKFVGTTVHRVPTKLWKKNQGKFKVFQVDGNHVYVHCTGHAEIMTMCMYTVQDMQK